MFKKFLALGLALTVLGIGLATFNFGASDKVSAQTTNLAGNYTTVILPGAPITIGAQAAISGCATVSAQVGGAASGRFQTSGTACAPVFTLPGAAPNGWACFATDLTTAVVFRQASTTTTSCTFASATTVAADNIVWYAIGY